MNILITWPCKWQNPPANPTHCKVAQVTLGYAAAYITYDSCSHFSPCKPSTKWQGFQTMHVHRYPGFPTKCSKLKSKEIYIYIYMYLPQSLQILGIYYMNYDELWIPKPKPHLHKQVILIWYRGYIHGRISNMKTICSVKPSGTRTGCIMKLNDELGWPTYCQMWIAGDICLTHSASHQPNANTPWIVDFSKYGAKG